jgi:AcrR family transcriptional regulator
MKRARVTKAATKKPASPRSHAERPRASSKLVQEPDVRRRILRASRTLIEREGLSALSMREVARRAGVSHQAPYNHFADRAAILGALVEEGFVILHDRLVKALSVHSDAPSRIRAGARCYVEFAVQHPAYYRLMFRPELVDLDKCPGAMEAGDSTFKLFTNAVEESVAQGMPAEPSLDALIALCWSVCHGLATLILDGPLTRKLPHAQHEAIIEGVTVAFAAMMESRMESRMEPRVQSRMRGKSRK